MSDRDGLENRDGRSISEVVGALAHEHPAGRITFGEIVDRLGDRTYGLLILIFALPMVTPAAAIPGVSTLFGVPLMYITAQLALGFAQPRFPEYLMRRSIDAGDFNKVIDRIVPLVIKVERYLRPRYGMLTNAAAERVIGLVSLIMAIILSMPIAGANMPPALAMSLFAVAILERDGLFVFLGAFVAIWSVTIATLVVSLGAAGVYYAIHAIFG